LDHATGGIKPRCNSFYRYFAGTPVSAGEEAYHGRLTGDGGGKGLPIEEADRLLAQYEGPKGFDPRPILLRATAKMLWIFGTKDIVIPTMHLLQNWSA